MDTVVRRRLRVGAVIASVVTFALLAPTAAWAGGGDSHGIGRTVTYRTSDANVANPERGFDHETDTHYRAGGEGWEPLTDAQLAAWRSLGDTQINRVVYLDAFAGGADLTADFLARQRADFATARRGGFTLVLRFAYVEGGAGPYVAPFGDAPLPVVLKHVAQLTPLLRENVDVIATLQSGFVGLWGEGYYTDYYAEPATQEVSDADWTARRAIVQAEMDALPTRTVQVRTPQMKQRIVGTGTGAASALTPETAFRNTLAARIGHHNDCFLASEDDYGTYLSDPLSLDRDYLAADTRFVPMGGETCDVDPPRSEFPEAARELAAYHWSYLNREYNTDVLDSWGASGIATAERSLGYRLELVSSTVALTRSGENVTIRIRNAGWAAPYNPRPVNLVLVGGGRRITVPIATDVRSWAPGTEQTVTASLHGVARGIYRVSLSIPAAEAATRSNPAFAIRTANVGTWNARTGLNDLRQWVVVG